MRGARCEGGVEVEGVVGHDVGYSEVIKEWYGEGIQGVLRRIGV